MGKDLRDEREKRTREEQSEGKRMLDRRSASSVASLTDSSASHLVVCDGCVVVDVHKFDRDRGYLGYHYAAQRVGEGDVYVLQGEHQLVGVGVGEDGVDEVALEIFYEGLLVRGGKGDEGGTVLYAGLPDFEHS